MLGLGSKKNVFGLFLEICCITCFWIDEAVTACVSWTWIRTILDSWIKINKIKNKIKKIMIKIKYEQ